ncbi:hypothetical protein [Litoribacillus peritrichatus]|uniref:Uncharacterized protein n=1 Tax=Litoribacillus peritrichatus TaxID=718191 RepID=A0ABP7MJ85_9GAMM
MALGERLKYATEQAKKSAEDLFKKKPIEIQQELVKEVVLGNVENLAKPDNKSE